MSLTRAYAGRDKVAPKTYYRALSLLSGRSFVTALCGCPDCGKTFSVPGQHVSVLGLVCDGRVILCPHCSLNMQLRLMEWS